MQRLGHFADQYVPHVAESGSLEFSHRADDVGGRPLASCSQRLGVAQRTLQALRRRECERLGDLLVEGVVGTREADGQLQAAGGDQRPDAFERWRYAAALVAGDLLLRDAGAGGELALREPGLAAGLDEKA